MKKGYQCLEEFIQVLSTVKAARWKQLAQLPIAKMVEILLGCSNKIGLLFLDVF